MSLILSLRVAGASLIVLSLFHAALWHSLDWGPESALLSPLNRRVFLVHTGFIAFVLGALGLLSLVKPQLLLAPSELARLLLVGIVVFWIARLAIQPLVFDRVMRVGWTRSLVVRVGATLVWTLYVAVYGLALLQQFRALQPQ
jgi:hypothetical protein